MSIPENIWKILKKYPNVVGYSSKLQPRIRAGRVIPEEKCIRVYVKKKLPEIMLKPEHRIPKEIFGIPVDVVEIGEIRALSVDRTKKFRPAPGGVSIGHYLVTAGTLAVIVKDRVDGEVVILSNNHVLANENRASRGDQILQPGPYDGGKLFIDTIGYLKRFVSIKFSHYYCPLRETLYKLVKPLTKPVNYVDAAIASPISRDAVTHEILEIGVVKGKTEASEELTVVKSGRTTGVTRGVVFDTSWNGNVIYTRGVAYFEDQILIHGEKFSAGGDSGSLVLDTDNKAIGLLFAGSEYYTVVNKISRVEEGLNVDILSST